MAHSLMFLLVALCCLVAVLAKSPSLVITMICRDEEVNLKANLAKWLPFVDYFVFLVDSRTIDKSVDTIKSILTDGKKQFKVVDYTFTGFGMARTQSLAEAWKSFPQATHVLIADPDWAPRVDTIKIEDLNVETDVYRFTVFDRNGVSRRKMDWMLRHREGLAMKYHLHEVLDIGPYSLVQPVGWLIDEIEKPGSWHSTVGHGNSTSLKRFEFDLNLLSLDLAMYGHDPHTDYYLGITNQAAASTLHEMNLSPGHYLTDALYYMNQRVISHYGEEFADERWGSMYMLGVTYGTMEKNYEKAAYWLSMCRDLNPSLLECGIALSKLHLSYGVYEAAWTEVNAMLKLENFEREYLTHFRQRACELPELVVTMFTHKAIAGLLTANEAKYLLLMLQMQTNPVCTSTVALTDQVTLIVKTLLKNSNNERIAQKQPALAIDSTADVLCGDGGLQNFMLNNRYVVHPCETFREQMAAVLHCVMFTFNMPPANEELHANTEAKEFVGAAMMPDIIHHVFKGNSSKIFTSGHTYRFLFAQYFNPKMIYNLIGFFDRTGFTGYEIVVVAEDAVATEIRSTVDACSGNLKNRMPFITYSKVEVSEYIKTALVRKKHQTTASGLNSVLFDYVEYSYGISISKEHESELAGLKQLLQPEGVVGLTYFAKNHHTESIQRTIASKNNSAMIPFSLEHSRLVTNYLDLHSMSFLIKDAALITYLSGEVSTMKASGLDVVDVEWQGFSQSDVLYLLSKVGLTASAWMPSGYSHPYDKIDYYQVKRFKALGMSQERFVEDHLSYFRYTVYVQSGDNNAGDENKKATLSVDLLNNQKLADQILIIDRLGSLGNSFSVVTDKAAQGLPTTFAFAPYSLSGKISLQKVVLAVAAACMPHLSSGMSLWGLHKINVDFVIKHKLEAPSALLKEELISLLSFLETVNAVTFLCDGCEIVAPSADSSSTPAIPPRASLPVEPKKPTEGSVTADSDSKIIKIGGLNVKMKNKQAATTTTTTSSNSDRSSGTSSSTSTVNVAGTSSQTTVEAPGVTASANKATDNAKTDSPANTQMDIDVQIKRMRALGFSEAKIADTLAKKAASKGGTLSAPVTAATSTAPVEENKVIPPATAATVGGLKLKSRSGQIDPIAVNAGPPKVQKQDPPSTVEASTVPSSGITDEQADLKVKLKGILTMLADKEKKQQPSQNSETVAAKETIVPPVAAETNSAIAGGLLQKRAQENKLKQQATKSVPASASASSSSSKSDAGTPSASAEEIIKKVKEIKLPSVQSRQDLVASYRRIECYHFALDNKKQPNDCNLSGPVKRKTAVVGTVSATKLEFDMAQFRYLQKNSLLSSRLPLDDLLAKYEEMLNFVNNRKQSERSKLARLAISSLPSTTTGLLSRVVQVSSKDADVNNLVHLGAVKYLQSVSADVSADFVVVDILLKEAALHDISNALLASTIWFDSSNGLAMVAHHDDGLVLESVKVLSQYIAFAVSTPAKPLRVLKYYTVAMSLDKPGTSAVAMANGEEMVAILWLNPSTGVPESNTETPIEDGLKIYDDFAAVLLYSQGTSVFPSSHSDFFSRSGDLNIDMATRCNSTSSELVQRKANRLVLLQPRRPFFFTVPPSAMNQQNEDADSFKSRTMLALVVFLGR